MTKRFSTRSPRESWQDGTIETNLSATWDETCQEAWFVIADRPAGQQRVQEYAWWMRVEATFHESKSRGWDLEASLIEDFQRLNRLLLALFLAIWWVTHLAASCIHHGLRHRFDRRDKGIFRLGRLWLFDILRRVKNAGAIGSCFPFRKQTSGWSFSLRF